MRVLSHSLLSAAAVAGLSLFSTEAAAQHLVWPEVGVGVGTFTGASGTDPAIQLDFSVGWEQQGFPWSPGVLFRFDAILVDEFGQGDFDQFRFDVAPLFTVSSTYDNVRPFFRAGAGPLLTLQEDLIGVGAHGELSVGLKSIVELYVDGRVSPDGFDDEIELGVTGGFRLNAFIADAFNRGRWWW